MIKINTLNPIVETQLKHDRLIYEASNGKQINIKKMAVIVDDADPEKVIDILHREKYKSGYHPFYFQHTDLFKQSQELFSSIFGCEPDIVIYAYKSDLTSSIFLFANKILIQKASNKQDIEISLTLNEKTHIEEQLRIENNKGIDVNNVKVEGDLVKVKLPNGVFPVIGALNSMDSGWRTPNFNLIFGTTDYSSKLDEHVQEPKKNAYSNDTSINNQNEDKEPYWIGNVDDYLKSNSNSGITLYSIDKFDFKEENKLNDVYNPSNMTIYFNESLISSKIQFCDTIVSFLLAINRGSYLPINDEQFSSFMPHFYGYDRLKSSVARYDSNRRKKLKRIYDTSHSFAKSIPAHSLTCKNIIDYFLRNSIINFDALAEDPGKEILKAFKEQSQVTTLTQDRDILSSFITAGAPNTSYNDFLNGTDGQMEAKTKTYKYL
jgi:hypothetical protein